MQLIEAMAFCLIGERLPASLIGNRTAYEVAAHLRPVSHRTCFTPWVEVLSLCRNGTLSTGSPPAISSVELGVIFLCRNGTHPPVISGGILISHFVKFLKIPLPS